MLSVSEREKVFIHKLEIGIGTTYLPIEISLPAQIKRIKGIILSSNIFDDRRSKVGTVSLQSNDNSDVFLCVDIFQNFLWFSGESRLYPSIFGGESQPGFVNGRNPQRIPVEVDGTTGSIHGWYKPATTESHTLRIYIEYEVQEEGL